MKKLNLIIEKLRIPISRIFAFILLAFLAVSHSGWEQTDSIMGSLFFLVGVLFVAVASMGRMWCSLYIAGYKTEVLITEGPYSMSRNPLYFFSFIGAIGVGFASKTILIPLVLCIVFMMYYPFVINSEENELQRLHAEKYEEYVRTTPKFFPKISHLKEPKKYTVNPIVFKTHLYSAVWFIWLVGILAFIEKLHELNVIPVFFKIY